MKERTEEQMQALEQSLAYENATSFLEGATLSHCEGDEEWMDVSPNSFGEDAEDEYAVVLEAVAYLEWRGLLVRHAENLNWIRVLDEDDAADAPDGDDAEEIAGRMR